MNKNAFTSLQLNKGEMRIYDFGAIKLHAYQTNDLISDEVFIVEKNGKAVIIESPCFFDNNQELSEYLQDLEIEGLLIAYHDAGGSFLPDVAKYTTPSAQEYGENGGGKALIDNFAAAFGKIFDQSLHKITNLLNSGTVTIGDIYFIITPTAEAFNIEIPEINAIYIHMLGHDCHSIVAGTEHADALIAELNGYIDKKYDLILTSHYTPEDLQDAKTKIAYLKNLQKIAAASQNVEAFKTEVQKQYPDYSGLNYLDMTAGFFFAN